MQLPVLLTVVPVTMVPYLPEEETLPVEEVDECPLLVDMWGAGGLEGGSTCIKGTAS